MNLETQLLQQIDAPGLAHSERVRLRCLLAKELEGAGNYEAARNAMGELWQHVGGRPALDGLDKITAAEVLLRAGSLSGWIGSSQQIEGAQEKAKDLISESITLFEQLDEMIKAAEARTDLAVCYWREGAFDEAQVILRQALNNMGDDESETKVLALTRLVLVERSAGHHSDALRILSEAAPLAEAIANHSLKGKFHGEFAVVLRNLGTAEKREDYIDRALVEYAAAIFHFEQAEYVSYRARAENNLGFLFLTLKRFEEAHEHLDRARRLFVSLKNIGSVAQVDETRARALLGQGQYTEAERVVRSAVRTLEKGGEQALLAEALTTHGLALARLVQHQQSRLVLERAVDVAEQAGDLEGAGRAALTLIEELHGQLTEDEIRGVYLRADELLSRSQHAETLTRLRECARRVVDAKNEPASFEIGDRFIYGAEETGALLSRAWRVAKTDCAVLITGETGTGKEVLARLIHEWSGRGGQFVPVNCGALTDTLIESQLFGHLRGSFVDALRDHPGAVREAAGGTLFLDEVCELSRSNQGKLLRLIEHHEVHAIGGSAPERVNVRIIAATNRDLKEEIAAGRFRADLYYRLTFHVELPPLRERPEDISAIAQHFIEEACARHKKRVVFTPAGIEAMRRLTLNGNARELRILIEQTVLVAREGSEISAGAIETVALRRTQKGGFANAWEGCSLNEEVLDYEKSLVRLALNASQGSVTHAARLLGVTHQTLASILNTRHKDLLDTRKPIRRRRRSIIYNSQRKSQ